VSAKRGKNKYMFDWTPIGPEHKKEARKKCGRDEKCSDIVAHSTHANRHTSIGLSYLYLRKSIPEYGAKSKIFCYLSKKRDK
jgi:hypothetical protein